MPVLTSDICHTQYPHAAVLDDSTIVREERSRAGDRTTRRWTVGERIALGTEVVRRTGLGDAKRGDQSNSSAQSPGLKVQPTAHASCEKPRKRQTTGKKRRTGARQDYLQKP